MISDELLCSATGEYEKAILSALPEATECNHTFSQRFEKKMRHLCHKTKHQPTYHILKRIACVLVAIILCGSMLLMLHIDVRAAVVGWIKEVYNSFIRYSFAGDDEKDEPRTYEITALPKGYTLLVKQETDAGNIAVYQNGDGQIMQLGCYSAESGMVFVGGAEYDHSQTSVFGKTADLYIARDAAHSNAIVWENADGSMLFQLTAFLEKDALIQVAESVFPTSQDQENKPAAHAYDLAWLPEGYILLDREEAEKSGCVVYADPDGFLLSFCYEFGPDAGAFFIKPEDHTHTQENINGTTMDIYLSNDPQYVSSIIWSMDDKVIFVISANCDKDTLIQLTRCVVPIYEKN